MDLLYLMFDTLRTGVLTRQNQLRDQSRLRRQLSATSL